MLSSTDQAAFALVSQRTKKAVFGRCFVNAQAPVRCHGDVHAMVAHSTENKLCEHGMPGVERASSDDRDVQSEFGVKIGRVPWLGAWIRFEQSGCCWEKKYQRAGTPRAGKCKRWRAFAGGVGQGIAVVRICNAGHAFNATGGHVNMGGVCAGEGLRDAFGVRQCKGRFASKVRIGATGAGQKGRWSDGAKQNGGETDHSRGDST